MKNTTTLKINTITAAAAITERRLRRTNLPARYLKVSSRASNGSPFK